MSEKIKIINLKPGMENVVVEARVLENLGVKTINTKAGVRTLGEYIVGDESGRVKLVLWGAKAASIASGDVISIKNAWVTSFKGEVQLNAGKNSSIDKISDESIPPADAIPEDTPRISEEFQAERKSFRRREERKQRGRRFR